MAIVARLFLVWLSGCLFTSQWINEELRFMLSTDGEIAAAVQACMSAAATGLWWLWWRVAKRCGWRT